MAEAKAKKEIPLGDIKIPVGKSITITKGRKESFALWHYSGIWDLPAEYVDVCSINVRAKH